MTPRFTIVILLFGCVLFAAIIFLELTSNQAGKATAFVTPHRPLPVLASPPQQKERLQKLVSVILARPLFTPTRRPPLRSGKKAEADVALADARLTGIVTHKDLRLAIFAIKGKRPLALGVGDRVSGWQIERITPNSVALRGPAGVRDLAPKPDHGLRRMPLPAAFSRQSPPNRPQARIHLTRPAENRARIRFGHSIPLQRGAAR